MLFKFLQSLYFEPEDTHEKLFIQKQVNLQFGQKWLFVKEKHYWLFFWELGLKIWVQKRSRCKYFSPNKLVDMRSMEIDVGLIRDSV